MCHNAAKINITHIIVCVCVCVHYRIYCIKLKVKFLSIMLNIAFNVWITISVILFFFFCFALSHCISAVWNHIGNVIIYNNGDYAKTSIQISSNIYTDYTITDSIIISIST